MLNKWLQSKHRQSAQFSFYILLLFHSMVAYGSQSYVIGSYNFKNIELSVFEDCKKNIENDWNKIDKYAWVKICTSPEGIVDFFDEDSVSMTDIKPSRPRLSQAFLKNILLDNDFTARLKRTGITIRYAKFNEHIELNHLNINFPLKIENSVFKSPVSLRYATVKDTLSFKKTTFNKKLDMTSANINGNLIMEESIFNDTVLLDDANIKNDLNLTEAKLSLDETTEKENKQPVKLNMSSVNVDGDIHMLRINSHREINLAHAVIKGSLELSSANIKQKLNLESIDIGGNLFMRLSPDSGNKAEDRPVFHTTNLREATVSGRTSLTGALFNCEKANKNECQLNMDSIFVDGDFHMRNADFHLDVFLTDANIGDELSLSCSIFTKQLKMDSITIGSDLFINNAAKAASKGESSPHSFQCDRNPEFDEIILPNATIGHNFKMIGATVKNTFDIKSSHIGGNLVLMKSSFLNIKNKEKAMDLSYIYAGGTLDISDIKFHSLDLRNATASSFKMPEENWLHNMTENASNLDLQLNGFTYQKIENEINETWKKNVVDSFREIPYAPQPYVQLAATLQNMAQKKEANEILIAKLNHKQDYANNVNDHITLIKLFIFEWLIGYGYGAYYGYFNSLVLVLIFVSFGVLALRYEQGRLVTIDNNKSKLTEDLFYSFDMLLPLVTLDRHHEEVTHKIDIVRYYFYFHKIMGYILAMIIAAGLSGLITPSGL